MRASVAVSLAAALIWGLISAHYVWSMHLWAEAGYGLVWQYYVVESWSLVSVLLTCLFVRDAAREARL